MRNFFTFLLLFIVTISTSFPQTQNSKLINPVKNSVADQMIYSDDQTYTLGIDAFIPIEYVGVDFEDATFPPTGWTIVFSGTNYWSRVTTASGYGIGVASAKFNFYSATGGTTQSLVTNTMTATVAGDSLRFDHAYATYQTENDQLRIDYSTDDGTTWTQLVLLNGGVAGELVTAPAQTAAFTPNAAQWATKSFSLPIGTNKVQFVAISAFGNNLYLDNISIGTPPANDAGTVSIDLASLLVPGTFAPTATVKNFGSSPQSFNTTFTINPGGYTSTILVNNLAPNTTVQVTFANWIATVGNYTAVAYTQLAGDINALNDTVTKSISVNDVAVSTVAPSPNAFSRTCCALVTMGGSEYIYQFGGGSGANLTSVARYDVTANAWTNSGFAPIPTGISSGTAIAVKDSFIYVFGGESTAGLGKTYKYNYYTNTWTTMANMLTLVTDAAVVKLDDLNDRYIYVIGGGDGLFGTNVFNSVQLYDVVNNTYTALGNYPIAAGMLGGGIVNFNIYTAGGWNGTVAIANAYQGDINPLDPTQITWTPIADYPGTATTRMGAFKVSQGTGAGVLFAGGAIGGSTTTANAYLWNYCANVWETLPSLSVARSNMKATGKGDNKVYVVAGFTGAAGTGVTDVFTFNSVTGSCYFPVPVELTSFAALTDNGNVTLNWTTATELNNSGFQIERNNGNGFEVLGFVSGSGTTTEIQNYSFVDQNVKAGSYSYRLKQVDFNGSFEYSDAIEVVVLGVKEFTLGQNYPNPFNPSTSIRFSLAVDSKVSLKVFDVLGQEVATLINGQMTAGSQVVNFDASQLNSGVYFYRIDASGLDGQKFSSTKKMILTK